MGEDEGFGRSELNIAYPADLEGGLGDEFFAGGLKCRTQQWMPAGVVLLGHRELDLHEVLYAVTCNDHSFCDFRQVLLVPDDFFRLRDIDLQVTVVDPEPGSFFLTKRCGMTDLVGICPLSTSDAADE